MPSLHSQFSPSFCRIACCGLEKKASPTEQDATLAPSLVYSSLLKGHRSAIDDIPCMSHQPCQGGFVGLQSPLVEASSNQFCPGSPSREAFSTISTSGIAVRTSLRAMPKSLAPCRYGQFLACIEDLGPNPPSRTSHGSFGLCGGGSCLQNALMHDPLPQCSGGPSSVCLWLSVFIGFASRCQMRLSLACCTHECSHQFR